MYTLNNTILAITGAIVIARQNFCNYTYIFYKPLKKRFHHNIIKICQNQILINS
jgi:hypothetical protein